MASWRQFAKEVIIGVWLTEIVSELETNSDVKQRNGRRDI